MKRELLLKKLLIFAFLLMGGVLTALAQNKTLRGKVTDENDVPLIGATVQIKSTSMGAITDIDGNYTIVLKSLPPANAVIEFSYIGYTPKQETYNSRPVINVLLKEDTQKLNEVLVTALGIKKEEKGLSYSAQKLDNQILTDAKTNNWSSALVGKVAGAQVTMPSSGPINSSKITLRGESSLNPKGNNALIVVDGVPLSSQMTGTGYGAYGAGAGGDMPVDYGNGFADINPDDIESVTVLKGASATALYGSRAANGALIITTKSGVRTQKGIGVTINSNVAFEDVSRWPEWQYEYGQSNSFNPGYYSYGDTRGPNFQNQGATGTGSDIAGGSSAWGEKFDPNKLYYQYDPVSSAASTSANRIPGAKPTPWVAYPNNIKDFFRTGVTFTNSVAIENSTSTGSLRASLTHLKNDWIMPNTGYQRITASLSLNQKISKNLRFTSKVSYTNRSTDNLPVTGYTNQSIGYFMIFQMPNMNLEWQRPIWKPGKENIEQIRPFSPYPENPFGIAYTMLNPSEKDIVIGNMSLVYEFSRKFELMLRSGIEYGNEKRSQERPYGSANFPQGYLREQNVFNFENNTDALFTYRDNFGGDFDLNASVGGNIMTRKFNLYQATATALSIPGVFKMANSLNLPLVSTQYLNKQIKSIYMSGTLSYQKKLFLDLTGRNDWSSTLPKQNNSFFYSSVGVSAVVSDMVKLPSQISFAKVRMSFAQVGNDTEPYKTSRYYNNNDFAGSATVDRTLFNSDFKPEITTATEAGLDLRFFDGQLGLDVSVYNNVTRNQILDIPLPDVTGYANATMNAGSVRNRGLELQINATPIRNRNFSWTTTLTWATNKSKVLSLAEGMLDYQRIGKATGSNGPESRAYVGGTANALWGLKLKRSPDGQVLYQSTNGLPIINDQYEYIGEPDPKWTAGWANNFTYKQFRFSMLIDGRHGGVVYSQSHHKSTEQGKLKHTLAGREEGFIIGQGVCENADGTYSPNTTKANVASWYGQYYALRVAETNTFDASFLKLRECRLDYSFPKKMIKSTFINELSVGVYGRDLFMITNFPWFTPETAALNDDVILNGIEMGQMPTTRSYGVNLTVRF